MTDLELSQSYSRSKGTFSPVEVVDAAVQTDYPISRNTFSPTTDVDPEEVMSQGTFSPATTSREFREDPSPGSFSKADAPSNDSHPDETNPSAAWAAHSIHPSLLLPHKPIENDWAEAEDWSDDLEGEHENERPVLKEEVSHPQGRKFEVFQRVTVL